MHSFLLTKLLLTCQFSCYYYYMVLLGRGRNGGNRFLLIWFLSVITAAQISGFSEHFPSWSKTKLNYREMENECIKFNNKRVNRQLHPSSSFILSTPQVLSNLINLSTVKVGCTKGSKAALGKHYPSNMEYDSDTKLSTSFI